MAKAVFLDRDGVLVRAPVVEGRPHSIRRVEELELEDGAVAACSALREAGFLLVVVTNQPEIARGNLSPGAVDAMLLANTSEEERFRAFNVATGDYVTVTEIADLAAAAVGLDPTSVRYEYTGGDRGWKGDVPIVRLSIERIRRLGWSPTRTSAEALRDSMRALVDAIRDGQL